ncbi:MULTISPECIES: helix-turn-helix domain-containing protein [Methylosinus]|uniref:Sigma-54-dependent Fis family transcriptional regulator n=1 Tax=Methylosinus trichosporium (strain ATCC 35070 / NCIMB 11131 / UNIQEM 75 / OB3b) TaxID=595536 RepID=A0A2D2D0F3_METT3|nr:MULTISPECIES: helix-turn-helix domain-containing protein [Methylosinus]ATQ68424.1 sigma-54-dependent Fis family transcriptional regulator [Methylosinus trichosporium OB3b]OBS51338.1 Fis family transcriptional regulator [Methylosinus sp. 3S-1]
MARRDAHAHRILTAVDDGAAPAASVVAASWRRCVTLYGLDPEQSRAPEMLGPAELRAARERLEPLMRAAHAPLDRLAAAVVELGCCVLLTDAEGAPVERRSAATDAAEFDMRGLRPGAIWSEAQQGTNGIGTCLAEGRALTIHRDQHFRTRNTALSCTVAPIHDHCGRLAAALDVSCRHETLVPGMIGLVAAAVAEAARAIEAAHFRAAFADARILLAPGAERGAVSLLAVDRDDLVIGATRAARLELGVTDAALAATPPAADLLRCGSGEALEEAERSALRRALARAEGNVSAAAKLLGVSRATLHRKLSRFGLR